MREEYKNLGLIFPRRLNIQTDNAADANKNKAMLALLSGFITTGVFDKIHYGVLREKLTIRAGA